MVTVRQAAKRISRIKGVRGGSRASSLPRGNISLSHHKGVGVAVSGTTRGGKDAIGFLFGWLMVGAVVVGLAVVLVSPFWSPGGGEQPAQSDVQQFTPVTIDPSGGAGNITVNRTFGDLDCEDINGPVVVGGSDPHGFDGDGDGIGCE